MRLDPTRHTLVVAKLQPPAKMRLLSSQPYWTRLEVVPMVATSSPEAPVAPSFTSNLPSYLLPLLCYSVSNDEYARERTTGTSSTQLAAGQRI